MKANKYVQQIKLATEVDKRVAFATAQIGDITIRGIKVWRSPGGKLTVLLPGHFDGYSWQDSVELPAELRSEIDAEVRVAYRVHKNNSAPEAEASEPRSRPAARVAKE